jgi:hypothetical protein
VNGKKRKKHCSAETPTEVVSIGCSYREIFRAPEITENEDGFDTKLRESGRFIGRKQALGKTTPTILTLPVSIIFFKKFIKLFAKDNFFIADHGSRNSCLHPPYG